MDCHQVIIALKLEFSDFDNQPAANGQPNNLWLEAVKSLCPMQIDFLWIELSDRLGCDWPDYIDKLSEHYSGENPPHTESGPYAWGF